MLLWAPLTAAAGSFKVDPIKLIFDQDTKTATLKLTNEGAEKTTVQLEAKSWHQNGKGTDQYSNTTDLVFFPKIADIAPDKVRLIRVGYSGSAATDKERTYRLFIQELPIAKPGEMAMRFALRMGLPVFLKPKDPLDIPVVSGAKVQKGNVLVTMGNNGNSHYVVNKVTAKGMDAGGRTVFTRDTGGWYVLAGGERIFSVKIPTADCAKARAVEIRVKVGSKTLTKTVPTNPALCQRPSRPLPEGKAKER